MSYHFAFCTTAPCLLFPFYSRTRAVYILNGQFTKVKSKTKFTKLIVSATFTSECIHSKFPRTYINFVVYRSLFSCFYLF